jgi:hypothetical protein
MNKIRVLPGIALILFFVFACTMPSEVEITGSPSIKFAANMNFNDYFSDMLDDALTADGDSKRIPCTNPSLSYMTFLMRMETFRKENYECKADDVFDTDLQIGNIKINGEPVKVEYHKTGKEFLVLDENKTIFSSSEPYKLTFKGIEEYIDGFEFTDIKSKVYISGTQLVDVLNIDLYQVDSNNFETLIVPDSIVTKGSSGVESLEEYTGLDLPPGGGEIPLKNIINSGGDLILNCIIKLPKYTVIDYDWLAELHTITVEIVIWFPMALEAVEENAKFKFPDFFDGIGDVLKSLAGTGCIETININIGIEPSNPFGNGIFVINDDNYEPIQSPLNNNSFSFGLNQKDVDYINKNPFDPNFFVLYPQIGTKLEIPNGDIMTTTVSLDAKFKYNMDLKNE